MTVNVRTIAGSTGLLGPIATVEPQVLGPRITGRAPSDYESRLNNIRLSFKINLRRHNQNIVRCLIILRRSTA